MSKIPQEFYDMYSGRETIKAETVGELIVELAKLPINLKLCQTPYTGIELMVYNHNSDFEHLSLEEIE